MMNFKTQSVISSISIVAVYLAFGVANAEEVKVTTYYPSPEGEYNTLNTRGETHLATSSGNVAIGASAGDYPRPLTVLKDSPIIQGTGTAHDVAVFDNAAYSNGIVLGYDTSGGTSGIGVIAADVGPGISTSNLAFMTVAAAGNFAERVRIDKDGKVGIGTTSPDSTLTVDAGASNTIPALHIKAKEGNSPVGVYFENTDIKVNGDTDGQFMFQNSSAAATARIYFGGPTWASPILTIDTKNNRVGIGASASSPATPLDVASAVGSGNNSFRFGNGGSSQTPSIMAINQNSGGRAGALLAGTTCTAVVFDSLGRFDIVKDSKSNFTGDTLGGGTTYFRVGNNGKVGIGTGWTGNSTDPDYDLKINGTAWVTSTSWSGSDIRWKKDIAPLQNSLDKVSQLNPVSFKWRKDEFPDLNFSDGRQLGLIAQEVEKVIPELVTTDNKGYKGISYEKLTPVLVSAIQEQQKEIKALQARLAELEAGRKK